MIDESIRHDIGEYIQKKTHAVGMILILLDSDGHVNVSSSFGSNTKHALSLLKQAKESIEQDMELTITY